MILQADARQIPLADGTAHCCVTSPPYWGLRDYGIAGQLGLEKTPEEYVANMVQVFREVRRVLRDDGTAWVNLGDSYAASGRGGPRSEKSAKQVTNRGSFTGSIRRSHEAPLGLKPKDLLGIPWRVAFALQDDGWFLRQDIIWAKPNPMPESVQDRCTKAHEYIFLLSKQARYYYDAEAIADPCVESNAERPRMGQGPNTQYQQKRRAMKMPDGWATHAGGHGSFHRDGREKGSPDHQELSSTRNKRSVWTIVPQPYKGAHFATFPEKLVEPCILAGCPRGGVVLDPFVGSGTTVKVARRFQRIGIGLDLNANYLELATRRLHCNQLALI